MPSGLVVSFSVVCVCVCLYKRDNEVQESVCLYVMLQTSKSYKSLDRWQLYTKQIMVYGRALQVVSFVGRIIKSKSQGGGVLSYW